MSWPESLAKSSRSPRREQPPRLRSLGRLNRGWGALLSACASSRTQPNPGVTLHPVEARGQHLSDHTHGHLLGAWIWSALALEETLLGVEGSESLTKGKTEGQRGLRPLGWCVVGTGRQPTVGVHGASICSPGQNLEPASGLLRALRRRYW